MDISQCPRCRTRFRGEVSACPIDGEALVRVQDPLLGRTIAGRYLIEDKIGGGGMGVVYRGRHQVIDRAVAIKFLHQRFTRDPTSRKRFLGEARAANQIDHDNIIDITDFGETEDGLVYLVMEYLQGRSLDNEIGGQPVQPVRAVRIAVQIASGLARAHELDVIHRDVKPANVFLIRRRGDPDFVKLLDFGIARFEREVRITDRGSLMGTPEYMAPEQVRHGEVNPSTDLYAVGCVLYEMLTGQPPFTGNMTEVLVKQMREPPTAPTRVVPGLRPELDAVVLKLLQKDPARRHRDAFHLVDDLQALLDRLPAVDLPAALPEPNVPAPAAAPVATSARAKPPEASQVRPTLHVPTEHEEWAQRAALYKQMLLRAHPNGDIPGPLQVSMQRMELAVASLGKLRAEIDESARQLTAREDEVRGTRLRIGRALDELARDESKLARALEANTKEVERAQQALQECVRRLVQHARDAPEPKRVGDRVSGAEAARGQALHAQLVSLASADARVTQMQAAVEKERLAWDDLHFQVAQLKGRLATLNAESSVVVGHTQERVHKAEAELRIELERLVTEAERLADHLRERPEFATTMRSPALSR